VSRAGDAYCNDNNGRNSENITQRKNTAAGGWGTMLRVKWVLCVYVCIFLIVGVDPLGCSYRWYVQEVWMIGGGIKKASGHIMDLVANKWYAESP
jgi:hypothetical protein